MKTTTAIIIAGLVIAAAIAPQAAAFVISAILMVGIFAVLFLGD